MDQAYLYIVRINPHYFSHVGVTDHAGLGRIRRVEPDASPSPAELSDLFSITPLWETGAGFLSSHDWWGFFG